MHTLHVRNVPSEVYEALRKRAEERQTSISAETIRLLKRALRVDGPGLQELLEQIEKYRPEARPGSPSAAELIREHRDRR
ncbi:MAG: hypothetical protein ACE5F1_19725 [Planctomycetota bacterium]